MATEPTTKPATTADPAQRGGRTTVRAKLLLANSIITIFALGLLGLISYTLLTGSLERSRKAQLGALRSLLARQVNDFFQTTRAQIATQAESQTVQLALAEFAGARRTLFAELGTEGFNADVSFMLNLAETNRVYYENNLVRSLSIARSPEPREDAQKFLPKDREALLLQSIYTIKNPAPVGAKYLNNSTSDILSNEQLDRPLREAFFRSNFAVANNRYQPYFKALADRFGYEDVNLIDDEGNVVYSLNKELDFATNVRVGPGRNSALGDAFFGAWYADSTSGVDLDARVMLTDFAPYDIAYDAPSTFMATPVTDNVGRRLGVLVFRLGVDNIFNLFNFNGQQESIGLGKTGEAYMVGPDFKLRSDARYTEQLPSGQRKQRINKLGEAGGFTS